MIINTTAIKCGIVASCVFASGVLYAAGFSGRQALTTSVLKVCADPGNLPFSNDKLEGFENRIVSLLAERMQLEVRYTWFPQTVGFVRNTLRLRECDLISGITTTSERVQNTNPYYRSVYTMVYRKDSGITASSMDDPALKTLKLGVVAGTPPATVIARLGLLGHVKPYHLVADTRRYSPARQAIADVGSGVTDVAFIWGPIAAHFAGLSEEELTLVPLVNEDKSVRLDFRVSMAVRYNETDWKHQVNAVLKELQPQINSILHEFSVPLLSDRGQLISK
ncbi:hypothetical protein AB833_20760 [Chromatiales bacterium (ex Bugula neritina AB1)]|nr:hypothetical protein AB833_20760 [Chromatiales bacterium (ex Bugula neritina AB1)]